MKTLDAKSNPMSVVSEPELAYARPPRISSMPGSFPYTPEDELMTVDEYFDELRELVHQDYARLRGEN